MKHLLLLMIALILVMSCKQNKTADQVSVSDLVYVRFVNQISTDSTVIFDVQARSNTIGKEIFGMNVRFFYDANHMVNGAIQLTNKTAEKIKLDTWQKIFSIELVPVTKPNESFCPVMIWDKLIIPDQGGFLGGSEGVTITIRAPIGSKYESAPTLEIPEQYNWKYTGTGLKGNYPYGQPIACIK